MSFENVFPFLGEERELAEKRRLDFLKGLLEVMERDEKKQRKQIEKDVIIAKAEVAMEESGDR